MNKLESIEDLNRYDIESEEMLIYFGIQDALKITNRWTPSEEEIDEKVVNWTKKFVLHTNPFLWAKWFHVLFNEKEIPLYRDLLYSRAKFEWFSRFSNIYNIEKPYKVSNLWGFVGMPAKNEVEKAFRNETVKKMVIEKLIWAFSAEPKKSTFIKKKSRFSDKIITVEIHPTSRFGFRIPAVNTSPLDPGKVFWGISNLREFHVKGEKLLFFKKLIYDLLNFLESI